MWIHGRQFPEALDEWDGNWLRVTAICAENGSSVRVSGAILDTVSIARWQRELQAIHDGLAGQAELDSDEPELTVHVSVLDGSHHLRVRVEVTPDHLAQLHRFDFDADQSHLPDIIQQCHMLLLQYPVRHPEARGLA